MSTLRQTCPACNRLLELPATAAGKMAKCPACQTQFAVPVVAGDGTSQPKSTDSPFSRPIGGSIEPAGHEQSPDRPAPNPYQPSAAAVAPTALVDGLPIVPRSVEEIFGTTIAIFKERWGSLVGAFLIVFAISMVLFACSWLLTAGVRAAAGQDIGGLVQVLSMLVTYPISAYLYVGFIRNAIAVARNEPSPINALVAPLDCFLRFVGGALLLGLAMMGVLVLAGAMIAALAALGLGEGVAVGLILLMFLVLLPIGLFAWWALWAWPFVVSDGKGSVTGSIKSAYAISMHNKMTSLLIIVIVAAMSVAGVLACYIGQIVTTPLTTLFMAVGYMLITGQPVEDPRTRVTQQFAPRPQSPTF